MSGVRCCNCQDQSQDGSFESMKKEEEEYKTKDGSANESSFIHLTQSSSIHHNDSPPILHNRRSVDYVKHFMTNPEDSLDISKSEKYRLGFLKAVQHTSSLVDILRGDSNFAAGDVYLCESCVDRLHVAIEDHIERLERDCRAYTNAVELEEAKTWKQRDVSTGIGDDDDNDADNEKDSEETGQTIYDTGNNSELAMSFFQEEIQSLSHAYQQQKEISQQLTELMIQEEQRAHSISMEEDHLLRQFNALELDMKHLQWKSREMASKCQQTQNEMESLMNLSLNSTLFVITNFQNSTKHDMNMDTYIVPSDTESLEYPTINGLRLTYRANQEITWNEVNAAWAQVALLLYFVGNVLDHSSKDLRIVPLTTCAKIIEITSITPKKKVEHNLGVNLDIHHHTNITLARSLRPLNRILHQLVTCAEEHTITATSFSDEIPQNTLPFQMPSQYEIGKADLTQLEESDDASWLYTINCMAANLDWLSRNVGLNALCLKDI